ncbi:MAG: bifunctional tetrahydrofolate synthase/dihydrofolate synthase [Buchnera aphidicola (Tetraneura akinire)]
MNNFFFNKTFSSDKYRLSKLLSEIELFSKYVIVNDLSNITKVAHKLDLLNMSSFIFTVTGTNGKGSTCFILEKYLLMLGLRVGLYISPHLIEYKERVRINGEYLTENKHFLSLSNVLLAKGEIALTYFEIITLSSLLLFKQKTLDVIILEVGIGGRLDATNVINSDISIITNIGLDHKDRLGSNRDSIGFEKSGIFRKNKIAIFGDLDVPISVYKESVRKNVHLKRFGKDWKVEKKKRYWNFISNKVNLNKLKYVSFPIENVALALISLHFSGFKIIKSLVKKTINSIFIPGRFQTISLSPWVILDVCHNSHAAIYLSKRLSLIKKNKKIHVLIGMLKDKDVKKTILPFINLVDSWTCSKLNTDRSINLKDWKNYLDLFSFFEKSHDAFFHILNNSKRNDIVLIYGSFFLVSEILFLINYK